VRRSASTRLADASGSGASIALTAGASPGHDSKGGPGSGSHGSTSSGSESSSDRVARHDGHDAANSVSTAKESISATSITGSGHAADRQVNSMSRAFDL
jgi:hypothetical protein